MSNVNRFFIALGAVVLALGSSSYGYTINEIKTDYWAGSGSQSAALVIDFGSGDSYAFGYHFDGAKTGWDMMKAISDAGSLDITYTDYGAYGVSLDSVSYNGKSVTSDWINSFLGYWVSDNGAELTASNVGMSSRSLSDGSIDGWSVEDANVSYDALNQPVVPVVNMPEPASLALLAMGGMMVLRKKFRRA